MSEIKKQAGKYDAVISTQPQSPMYGAVMGGIDGLKNRFESVEDVSEKARILEEALQYEEEGKKFIIDILKRENQENLIKEILLKNPTYSEFIINIIFEQQPATILKVSAIKIWNKFRAKNIHYKPDLSNINLANANLKNANLSDANLRCADLRCADLSWADLPLADLSNADLSNADLSWADLSSANLLRANLEDVNLEDVNLEDVNLRYANLRYANLRGANLEDANLEDANLRGANLEDANLEDAVLGLTDLSYVKLNKNTKIDHKWRLVWNILNYPQSNKYLRNADLWGSNLKFADLSNADLSNANLWCADLIYANLSNADLSGANLRGADLKFADLSNANLSNANLWRANLMCANLDDNTKIDTKWRLVWDIVNNPQQARNLSDADLSDADLWGSNLKFADLSDADLSDADLSDADLSDANLSGTNLKGANLNFAKFDRVLIDNRTVIDDEYKTEMLKVCIFKETEKS